MWWTIDTYMTGASSICLFMAALHDILSRKIQSTEDASWNNFLSTLSSLSRRLGLILHLIGAACLLWFWMAPAKWQEMSPMGLEDWYLFPPVLAGGPVAFFVWQLWTDSTLSSLVRTGYLTFALGGTIAMLSIAMDRHVCEYFGPSIFLDTFTASTGVFFACDLCFLGLLWAIQSLHGAGSTKTDKTE